MRLAGCTFLPWGREDHGIGSGGSVRVDLGSPQFSRGFAEAGPVFKLDRAGVRDFCPT
jgi:hypothetical protein